MSQLGNRFKDETLTQTALGTEIKISQASLAASWRRSSSFGLDPNGKPVDAVKSETEFLEITQKNEYIKQFVAPELELLYNQIAGTNFMVAYADSSGVVLDALLDEEFKTSDAGRAVIPGSIWTENYRGTNALGLCLHTGTSQIVAGRDHFFRKLGDLSCFAAPIYGQNNEIVGMIDATSDASSRQQHTLALVKLACKNVENRLFIDEFRNSSIISFHARHEYLSTTSAALLAVDEHGFIDGANINAKIMLNGLNLSHKRHFGDIFAIPYSSIANRLNSNEIIRIHDAMGSAVFMAMKEPTTKRIIEINPKGASLLAASSAALLDQGGRTLTPDDKPQTRCYISEDSGLKRHLMRAERALTHDLPIFIEGPRGSGKKATAQELHETYLPKRPFVEIKCNLLTAENHEELLFGPEGKLAYFQPNGSTLAQNKLRKAQGGSLFISGIENLPLPVQKTFVQIFEARQECELGDYEHKIAAVFVSSRLSLQDLRTEHDMDPEFLDSIFGAQILLPSLAQRMDFRKLAAELLKEISPEHILSKPALDLLETREWPGHIRQLKKMLQVLVANSATTIIRPEAIEGDQNMSGGEIIPCAPCAQSPMRKESCVLIQKTWMDSGGNISLVARRLGVSRTTIYKHIKGL